VDLNLVDSEDVPRPREEVRLRRLAVTPLGDGRRLRVQVELTPFLERPNVDLAVLDAAGEPLARATIVEADSPSFSLTMHLRGEPQAGEFTVRGELSYTSSPPQDVHEKRFVMEPSVDDRV
jgi:hypothetical protein